MKCEVARDLLTLYVEELCSPEAAKELEAHLEGCPKCREQLEHYKKGIEEEKKLQKEQNKAENERELNPWKKVRIKNIIMMLACIFGTILLIALLGVIGTLFYGEATNECMSFSTLSDMRDVKKICENLTKGEIQDLMDVTLINAETVYANKKSWGIKSVSDYPKKLKEDMEEAYAYHFKGKDISVKIEEVYQTAFSSIGFVDEPHTSIMVGFYEEGEQIYTITFGKMSAKKYLITESASGEEPGFLERVLPDELVLDIVLKYTVENQYEMLCAGEDEERVGSIMSLIIRGGETEEAQSAYKEQLSSKMTGLYQEGWYIKETMISVEEYDEAAKKWIYKVWFLWEDQEDKDIGMVEYKFHYKDSNLYVIEGQQPEILAGEDRFPEEIKKQLITLFE